MPGFDKQYPPSCIDPRNALHRYYQTEFWLKDTCLFQVSKLFSFWTRYIFHQLSYRFVFFQSWCIPSFHLKPKQRFFGENASNGFENSLFNSISKAAACSVYFLIINSTFDWYFSITNLFTEIMIDWSGKEIEHLTVAKESFYQSRSKIKHESFITILWYVI